MKTHILILIFCILLGFSINDNPDSNVGLTSLLTLNTEKPFVYRSLLPQFSNGISWLIGVDPKLIVRLIGSLLFFGSFVLCQKMTRSRHVALYWTASILFLMIINHIRVYAYDPLTLFSFSAAYLALLKGHHRYYLAAFILASLNRETAILLIGLFAIYQYGKPNYYLSLAIQSACYLAIRLTIIYLFYDYPGTDYQTHWLLYLSSFQNSPIRFSMTYGLIIALACLMVYQLGNVSPFVRAGIIAVYLPSVLLMALFGNPFEIRVLLESQPIIVLFIANFLRSRLSPSRLTAVSLLDR